MGSSPPKAGGVQPLKEKVDESYSRRYHSGTGLQDRAYSWNPYAHGRAADSDRRWSRWGGELYLSGIQMGPIPKLPARRCTRELRVDGSRRMPGSSVPDDRTL